MFNGPQIRTLIGDEEFVKKMNYKKKAAWLSFVQVVQKFLGNTKANNYEVVVNRMLLAFRDLGCNMSIKIHFLTSHLDDVSDEQGELFHQDPMIMEERYQGRWDRNMIADYCWSIKRDCTEQVHRRKSYKRKFLPD